MKKLKHILSFILALFLITTTSIPLTACKNAEIKNLIIIIGDGMGLPHITAGELANDTYFSFTEWDMVNVNTDSVTEEGLVTVTTDSAAAGTALATGTLTINGKVGKDKDGNDLKTVLDYAKENGKSTGILTTDKLYGATPAAFSAHANSRNDTSDIISSQINSGVDLLMGSFDATYLTYENDITSKGYALCSDFDYIEDYTNSNKAYCLIDLEGYGSTVALADAAEFALDFLSKDGDGFALMIEQAHIDKNSHSNDFDRMAEASLSLNNTVERILDWIGDRNDTAILITADHETGGLLISANGEILENHYTTKEGNTISYEWKSTGHTNQNVGLFVYGVEEDFSACGFYKSSHLIKNTDVFNISKKYVS